MHRMALHCTAPRARQGHDDGSPVILTQNVKNAAFLDICRREALLRRYNQTEVILSSANTYSYDKRCVDHLRRALRPDGKMPRWQDASQGSVLGVRAHHHTALRTLLLLKHALTCCFVFASVLYTPPSYCTLHHRTHIASTTAATRPHAQARDVADVSGRAAGSGDP